jgi:hypothetical protein
VACLCSWSRLGLFVDVVPGAEGGGSLSNNSTIQHLRLEISGYVMYDNSLKLTHLARNLRGVYGGGGVGGGGVRDPLTFLHTLC